MFRLDQFLPYRLNRAAAAFSAVVSAVYRAEYGIGVAEWRVLATLGRREETASAIVADTAMHKAKVSRAVATLEARGWLERGVVAGDRRREMLRLTDKGRRAMIALAPRMSGVEASVLARMAPEDRAALERGLVALQAALDEAA